MRVSRRIRHERRKIERADAISWALLVFGLLRTVAWVGMIVLVLGGNHWALSLAGRIVFVALISFYANAATDLDQVTAAWAAIRAGRAHAQGVRNEQEDLAAHREALEHLEQLAELIHSHQLRQEK
jgi:hypothetical protein